jgi:GntR family transcriptional regulator, vanillate catabolism transcriptional regulator
MQNQGVWWRDPDSHPLIACNNPGVPRGDVAGSQTTRATLGLRELIFAGDLQPDQRVPEIGLAERLGVSRTPLRLALGTLAHEGLLRPLPGGGFVVCSFTLGDIADAIEVRGVLEGTAARFAAERLESPSDLATLLVVTDDLDAVLGDGVPDLERYVELNDEYHGELVRLSKSDALARAIANAVALPFASPGALLASQAALEREREVLVVAQHQHRAMLDAVRAGHGARAEDIAREHARLAMLNLELVLGSEPALERLPGAPLLRRAG